MPVFSLTPPCCGGATAVCPLRLAAGSPRRASRIQASHLAETMRSTLVSWRKPVIGRSSTVRSPSRRASRTAFFTVERHTPATAAICSIDNRQSLRLATSAATRARTACSACVNRQANPGGSRPEAAQRRRRSSDASVRGRAPVDLRGGAMVFGGVAVGGGWRMACTSLGALLELGGDGGQDHGPAPKRSGTLSRYG